MTKYTPRELFADWYRVVDLSLNENIIQLRLTAIDEALKSSDDAFWLNLVMVSLNLPIKDEEQVKTFVKFFKDVDSTFPLAKNDELIRCLAAIILCFSLDEQEDNNDAISLAVLTGSFDRERMANDVPLIDYAWEYFQQAVINNRNVEIEGNKLDTILTKIKQADAIAKADIIEGFEIVRDILASQVNLKEEINVLWWLVGQYSGLLNKGFNEIDFEKMVCIAPLELSKLSMSDLGFSSADAFLDRTLFAANKENQKLEKISLNRILEDFPYVQMKDLIPEESKISELTPILYCLRESAKNKHEILEKEFAPIVLASQLYKEFLLLKLS